MKRSMIIAAALCLFLLSLTGCSQQQDETTQQQPDTTQEQPVETPPANQAPPTTAEETVESPAQPEEPVYKIPTGVWLAATDVGYSNYYYFNAEDQSGSYLSLDYGLGMPFSYDGSGSELEFRMGEDEEMVSATVETTDSTEFTLVWEDDLPEKLTFVSEGTMEDFHFFSNDELAQMAVEHYAQETESETSPSEYGAMTNEDNTVTVQLYDNLGDHNSTSAWYIVDRFTATGTDLLTGEEIDLLADEAPEQEPETETQDPAEQEAPAENETSSVEEVPVESESVPADTTEIQS